MHLDTNVLPRFPRHRELLENALSKLWSDERVIGLLIGGSIAQGEVDFYSDVDLYVITRDEDFDKVFSERDVVAEAVGVPLFRFIADHNPGGEHDFITMYEGPVKVDWMYCCRSDIVPEKKWATGLIVKDEGGFLQKAQELWQGEELVQPTDEEVLNLNQKFWTWCWYVFGKIMRGERWQALSGIHAIRRMALLPMMEWAEGNGLQGYRRLERKICEGHASQLAATVSGLQQRELYTALEAAIGLYQELRNRVFERYGLMYDSEPEEIVVQEMTNRADELWQ